MKKILKSRLFFLLVGMLISFIGTAFAYSYLAEDIGFTPVDNEWNVRNVDEALNDFREVASQCQFGCDYEVGQVIFEEGYSGAVQSIHPGCKGSYKLEVWGAQGAGNNLFASGDVGVGGKGGYSTGVVSLTKGEVIYIHVGGVGKMCSQRNCDAGGGYNGGGSGLALTGSAGDTAAGGGGATDMRINENSLYARVIVAGGGGGGGEDNETGGFGGGTVGGAGNATGGTQTTGFAFGKGADASVANGSHGTYGGPGAGGGWYGGTLNSWKGAGGGSGYVYTESTASSYPSGCLLNSDYYLKLASTLGGNQVIPTHDGISTMTGNTGSGYAKITYLGL